MKVKKLLSLVLALTTILSLSIPAFAAEAVGIFEEYSISPRWSQIEELEADISASGIAISYYGYVYATNEDASISGTMYLQKYSSGGWSTVDSCSIRDTGYAMVQESFSGKEGTQYRTKVVVSVAGESATTYSSSITL